MRNYLFSLSLMVLLGVSMPLFAHQSHPKGPKDDGLTQRTVRILGSKTAIHVTLAYPPPSDIVDKTKNDEFNAITGFPRFFMLDFAYEGHFWQGVFGRVGLDIVIEKRKNNEAPWVNLDALAQAIIQYDQEINLKWQDAKSTSRNFRSQPFMSQLNGTKCLEQTVTIKGRENEGRAFYFLLDEDRAVKIYLQLVDNSHRPGLADSDWRPRAEAFSSRLQSTLKVEVLNKP